MDRSDTEVALDSMADELNDISGRFDAAVLEAELDDITGKLGEFKSHKEWL